MVMVSILELQLPGKGTVDCDLALQCGVSLKLCQSELRLLLTLFQQSQSPLPQYQFR